MATRLRDDDPGMKKFVAFLDKYLPGENKHNSNIAYAYISAQTLVHILQQWRGGPDPRQRHEAGREPQGS